MAEPVSAELALESKVVLTRKLENTEHKPIVFMTHLRQHLIDFVIAVAERLSFPRLALRLKLVSS